MSERRVPTSSLELLRWIGWAQRKAAEDWVRERELSHEQSFVLGYLVGNPGAIQRDIAEVSRTSAASVTSMLKGLEQRGLVERRTSSDNARVKRVHATPAGAALVDGFADALRTVDDEILSPLDDDERATLQALLTKIVAELPQPTRD